MGTRTRDRDHQADSKTLLQATIALIPDGTVAIEVDVCSVLLQWPFLSDISLGLAAASIFQAPVASEVPQDAAQAAAVQVHLVMMDLLIMPDVVGYHVTCQSDLPSQQRHQGRCSTGSTAVSDA